MGSIVADKFREAATLLAEDSKREGNVLNLGSPSRVIIAGDIHGHRQNLTNIISYASADGGFASPPPAGTVLILQEIIHGLLDERTGKDRSAELLLRAARLKIDKPDNVFFLMGNHDLAQFMGNEITKKGTSCCRAFREGVNYCFGEDGPEVYQAVLGFLQAMPIAAKFDNGVMTSHTLPAPERAELAGIEILSRPYCEKDCKRGGGLYEWTWGRDQTPDQLKKLAEQLGVKFFVLGHRHIEAGSMAIPERALAISSDGPGGCIFEFSPQTDTEINLNNVANFIKRISRL